MGGKAGVKNTPNRDKLGRKNRGPDVIVRADGYRMLWMPDHPDAHKGRVYEHRIVAERKIGRPLTRHDIVHHVNEDRADNRPENIEVVTKAWHQEHHLGNGVMTDTEIVERLREGWTYSQFAAVGVWQHRVSRLRKTLRCVFCGYPSTRVGPNGKTVCVAHADLPWKEAL